MARASDGTDVPVSPLPASSSNLGSPDGSLPDLEGVGNGSLPELDGTGYRATTMEEEINEIYLQLPLFLQKNVQDRKLRPDAFSNSGRPDD